MWCESCRGFLGDEELEESLDTFEFTASKSLTALQT
jgi:hypothetical protein